MREILPGLYHWRVIWPDIWSLECYFLETEEGSVVIDPIESSRLMPIDSATDVRAVIVTSGWHERSARLFGKRTGAPVFVPEQDLCMIEDLDEYERYGDGDSLPCGIRAIGVPGLTRGEQALLSGSNGGTLFTADCVGSTAKWAPNGMALGGHPNGHPTPAKTLSHLLDFEFVNLCPGHGDPLLSDGKQKLAELFDSGQSTSTTPPAVSYFPLDKNLIPRQAI
jgi:hypothetical protein